MAECMVAEMGASACPASSPAAAAAPPAAEAVPELLLLDWLLPLGLAGGGITLLLEERGHGIDQAEERVAAELDALDPIARAQVIKRVAARELGLGRDDEVADVE